MTELPPGWAATTIGAACEKVVVGFVGPGKKHYVPNGVPFLMGKNVKHGGLDLSDLERITPTFHESLKKSQLRAGDVVVVRIGRSGEAAVVPEDLPPANCAGLVIVKQPQAVLPGFLARYLNSPDGQRRAAKEVRGVTRRTLNTKSVKQAFLPLPPLNEQRRIVAKIEALMARSRKAKDALDAIPPLLERFRQSVLAAAFRGDLTADWRAQNPDVEPAEKLLERIRAERRRRWEQDYLTKLKAKRKTPKNDKWKTKYKEPEPVDASELPELPQGWCWARWSQLGFSQNGRAFPSKLYCDSGIRLLRPGNLHVSGEVRWPPEATRFLPMSCADEHSAHIVRGGELIMNLTAQSLKDEFLGRVCMTPPRDRSLLNQRLARLTPVGISVRFAFWLFKSTVFRRYVNADLNAGTLIQHMYTKQVDAFVFPLPPLVEQDVIVATLDEFEDRRRFMLGRQEVAEERLVQLDPSVLAKAFRGELVPQDPNDEPASVLLERIRAEREAAKPAKKKRRTRRARK